MLRKVGVTAGVTAGIDKEIVNSNIDSNIDMSVNTRVELSKLSKDELLGKLLLTRDIQVPLSIFSTNLAPLEALVKYLIETRKMPTSLVAKRLNRNFKTIWTTYNNVKRRELKLAYSEYIIPLSIFSKHGLSVSESLVKYMHEEFKIGLSDISRLMNRNLKTVWTCYNRSQAKISKLKISKLKIGGGKLK